MKQMKFLLVALMAVVMGMSVTSCMKGEENTTVPVFGIITLKNTFYPYAYEFQVSGSKVSFVTNQTSLSGLSSDATSGDVIFLSAQYDTETQVVDQNTTQIVVEVGFAIKLNSRTMANSYDTKESASNLANRSIIPLSNYQGAVPSMYGSDWLIIPIPYYTENSENMSKHSFTLAYFKDEEISNSTMKLHLYHNSSEKIDKEKAINVSYDPYGAYKAFDISYLLSQFKTDNGGQAAQKIVVITQEQSGSSPVEITEGSTEGYVEKEYTVDGYTAK